MRKRYSMNAYTLDEYKNEYALEFQQQNGRPPTWFIQTFGCQMNERDSETLAGMLAERGYREQTCRDEADVIIMNTCSVRENADQRFFGTLGQLKRIKEQRPSLVVAVCGCMMQQQHVIDTLKTKYPWVDIVFGTHNIHQFPQLLDHVLCQGGKVVDVWENGGAITEGLPSKRKYRHKAFVNIMYGCNNFCTYCIVPYTRGRERSRRPEDIQKEVESLAASGVKEVILLGQNVNSYGVSPYEGSYWTGEGSGPDFPGLIQMLSETEGIQRIRFMTSHPKDLSDRLIETFQTCPKLCGHIHLPVQAGSDRVLAKMNRSYTKKDYLELVKRLRQGLPDIAITTDIIVGFPGEEEEDFEETLDLCRQVRFDSAFTFLYSIRKDTPAERFTDQIPEEMKHQRFNRLVETINQITAEKNKAYEGRVALVLTEGISKNDPGMLTGRTDCNRLVNFSGSEQLIGSLVPVKITEAKTFSLTGRIWKEELQ